MASTQVVAVALHLSLKVHTVAPFHMALPELDCGYCA